MLRSMTVKRLANAKLNICSISIAQCLHLTGEPNITNVQMNDWGHEQYSSMEFAFRVSGSWLWLYDLDSTIWILLS